MSENTERRNSCLACFHIANGIKSRKALRHTCGLKNGEMPSEETLIKERGKGIEVMQRIFTSVKATDKLKGKTNEELGQLLYDHVLPDCVIMSTQEALLIEVIERLNPQIFSDES